jgi:hypothetical protein
MQRDNNEIAALRAENDQLRERLAVVEARTAPKLPPAQQPAVEEGVRVSFPRTVSIQMPTVEEFKKLVRIVKAAHPSLVPTFGIGDQSERQEFGNGFLGSFEIISGLKRTTTLDKRDASHWARNATLFLDARGDRVDVSVAAFMAAVVAAGDIPYSIGEYRSYVGLTYDGGAPASADAWRRVLETGAVRPSIVTSQPPLYDTPPVRIQQLQIRG